jgi:hypothetical protein
MGGVMRYWLYERVIERPILWTFNASTICLVGVCASLAFPSSALAYLDPGSSSLLLQLLLSGLAGGLIIVKVYWKRLKNWFSGASEHTTSEHRAGVDE